MDYINFYSRYVEDLKKEGREYKGWCPFHADSGSKLKGFSLNPENGNWFCFSCNEGGNSLTFCKKLGINIKETPDYNANYQKYSYGNGIVKLKPKEALKNKGKHEYWEGTKGKGLPEDIKPYNFQAIAQSVKSKRTLWICEGEKDTITMLESGELAIGIPSASTYKVLDNVSLEYIDKVIVVCDHDDAGRRATNHILKKFPWALKIEWPEEKPKGYDVTDLKNEIGNNFIETLKTWTVELDPYKNLNEHLERKYTAEMARDPDKLLGYTLTKFDSLAQNTDGIQAGFYVVGAETNVAKTAFLCNLFLDLLDTNEDLTGIYYSLDDNKDVIINRFLSITSRLMLNQVQRKQPNPERQSLLDNAYKYLSNLALTNRLFIRDASEINDVNDLENDIRRKLNRNLFVMVDGLYNLDVGDIRDSRKENIERANRLKSLGDKYKIPVICTGELRKKERNNSKNKTPSIDDLMETGKFAYNANLVLLLWPVKWEDYDNEDQPLLNMKYAKNKLSHFRGQVRLRFTRAESRIEEWFEM